MNAEMLSTLNVSKALTGSWPVSVYQTLYFCNLEIDHYKVNMVTYGEAINVIYFPID